MDLRVSASNLGVLLLEKYCACCLWFLIHLQNQPPFRIPMASIYNDFDHHTKRVVTAHIDAKGHAPTWLGRFSKMTEYKEPGKMRLFDSKSGVLLTGEPDALFVDEGGGIYVIDYKTARYTNGQDALKDKYRVQLNAYRYLLEGTTDDSVAGLALVYCEPEVVSTQKQALSCVGENGFSVLFKPRVIEVKTEADAFIPDLLSKYASVAELPAPPAGLEGCYDCARLEVLRSLLDTGRNLKDAILILGREKVQDLYSTFRFNDAKVPRSLGTGSAETVWSAWE